MNWGLQGFQRAMGLAFPSLELILPAIRRNGGYYSKSEHSFGLWWQAS